MSSKANNELRFWFELAEKLGCPVVELQARMSAREFTYWMGLWQLRAHEDAEAQRKADLERRAMNPGRGMRGVR